MMTAQQLRNIPIDGRFWYAQVAMSKAPGIKLWVNDKPRLLRRLPDYPTYSNIFNVSGLPRGCRIVGYDMDNEHYFTSEREAWEYYCEEIQKATKEIAKRKREYCKVANAYTKKIQDDAIAQMNDFLNRGEVDAV